MRPHSYAPEELLGAKFIRITVSWSTHRRSVSMPVCVGWKTERARITRMPERFFAILRSTPACSPLAFKEGLAAGSEDLFSQAHNLALFEPDIIHKRFHGMNSPPARE